jgi:hypothetical protein
MQNAVDNVYKLLVLRTEDSGEYEGQVQFGECSTAMNDAPAGGGDDHRVACALGWDDPI